MKKTPSKVARFSTIEEICPYLLPWAAQMAQTEEFMFQNVATDQLYIEMGVKQCSVRIS